MRKLIPVPILFAALVCNSAIINFDLSPAGTDKAVGLNWANEVPAVTNSTGSGNEIGSGISFDTATLTLSLSVGYGSAFGFTDLTGPATAMHIHGQAPTNISAPVLISLIPNHIAATNPAKGGFIGGTVVYTPEQAVFLLAGSNYINIHTVSNAAGEIRGQLIPVNTAPTVTCPAPATFECDGSGGRLVALNAQVNDDDGDPLTVVWTVDGAPIQTNTVPAGGPPTSATVSLTAFLTLGTHPITVTVSDGTAAPVSCSSSATVVDTTPPVITSAKATPNVLWPPNHKMVNVGLSVTATDICSSVTCRIKSVTSNEPINGPGKGKGNGKKSPDWTTTGPLSLQLRAERLGKGSGRTYTVIVECTDTSGNSATTNITIRVPHDQGDHSAANNGNNGNSNDSDTNSSSDSGSKDNGKGKGKGNSGKGNGKNG
jgi:hypothetical protein